MNGCRNRAFLAMLVLGLGVRAASAQETGWRLPASGGVQVTRDGPNQWRVGLSAGGECTLESDQAWDARPGDTFAFHLAIKVDTTTKALPELVCFDAAGKEIPVPPSLANAPGTFPTNWQNYRRVFPVRPGTAQVRARIRLAGAGVVLMKDFVFRPQKIDPYMTGALITQLSASKRNGIVLESNFGIVNKEAVASEDRDGDGKWALVTVDLDRLSQPEERGNDWRSGFEINPNAIFFSDGAVLKSDSVTGDRPPDARHALHFRSRVRRPGPYRVWVSDPGRAVALSLDGKTWRRHEGGLEIDLGVLQLKDSWVELWLDACYRDPVSVGPVYFDYVRLNPAEDPAAVERLVAAARQRPGKLARGSRDEQRVAVTVQLPKLRTGTICPVRCGLPIPRGELASAEHTAVFTRDRKEVPSQSRCLATWPDGSVKWLFVDFLHTLRLADDGKFEIVYGNRIRARAVPTAVTIRPSAAGLEVDTGAIRFLVPKSRMGIIENVRLPSGQTVQQEPLSCEILEASGRRCGALDSQVERLEVEQPGPLHAVIRAETKMPPSGQPASGFMHRARLHVFAGSPLIQIDYFVANTDSRPAANVGGSMASKIEVRSVALKLKPARPLLGASVEPGKTSPTGALIQKTEEIALLADDGTVSERKQHLPGRLSVNLKDGGSIGVQVESFREQYPKALRWNADELEISLWAEEGGVFDWIEGVGKTHHLALAFGGDSTSAAATGRLLAVAAPEWYCASQAFGPIGPAKESALPAVEATLARHIKNVMIGRVGLGFENYGDHSSGGYVAGTYLWDNNEYDVPAGCMVHFARTGDLDSLCLGLASALHYLDVDTIHYSSQHEDWARAQHVHSHGTFGHHTASGPNMHHAGYVQGLIWYLYFTGEPIGLEGAEGIAAWVLRNLGTHTTGMERALGHPLMTLNDVYEAIWDEKWLRGAAYLVDQALKWEHPQRGGFLAPITESPAYYAGSPFCGGLVSAGLIKFNSWANQPEVDLLLERNAIWTLTEVWRPPGGIMDKGGSPRTRGNPKHISSHLRLMPFVYARTQDPLFIVVPQKILVAGYGDGAREFGSRSTGLVFNYLPWFLNTLKDLGQPAPDDELLLRLPAPQLRMARGEESTLAFTIENRGKTAVDDLRLTCHPRLDFEVLHSPSIPRRLRPGERLELAFRIRVPKDLNLALKSNRIAYAHLSALFQRAGKAGGAHAWSELSVEK